jgi:hypothetical protein
MCLKGAAAGWAAESSSQQFSQALPPTTID